VGAKESGNYSEEIPNSSRELPDSLKEIPNLPEELGISSEEIGISFIPIRKWTRKTGARTRAFVARTATLNG